VGHDETTRETILEEEKKWQRVNTPGFQARFVKLPGREAFIIL